MKNKKILVVDDEVDTGLMVKARLESNGYDVDLALSGEEGLEKVGKTQHDLIILDVMLPGMNGYEVCSRIKLEQRLPVPVVMLTSRSQIVDERLGHICKADSYIRKPMSSELLLPEIQRLLKENV